jgi:hypothetical protein
LSVFEACNFRHAEIAPIPFYEKSDEINGEVGSEVASYDSKSAAFAFTPRGETHFAQPI